MSRICTIAIVSLLLVGLNGIAEPPKLEDQKSKLPPADFKLTATEFGQECKTDSKAAVSKYKGKIIEISGTVKNAYPVKGMLSVITLGAPDPDENQKFDSTRPFLRLNALDDTPTMCVSDDPELFTKVGRGQTLRIKARFDRDLIGFWPRPGPWFMPIELLEKGPETQVQVSTEKLAKAYSADRNKASDEYKRKTLILTGTVSAIRSDPKSKVNYLELTGDGKTVVECQFDDPELVAKYKVGDSIKLLGELTSSTKGVLKITSCYPIKNLDDLSDYVGLREYDLGKWEKDC